MALLMHSNRLAAAAGSAIAAHAARRLPPAAAAAARGLGATTDAASVRARHQTLNPQAPLCLLKANRGTQNKIRKSGIHSSSLTL